MRTNWERFLRWRRVWKINNDLVEHEGVVLNLPKRVALREMVKYLIESDREDKR